MAFFIAVSCKLARVKLARVKLARVKLTRVKFQAERCGCFERSETQHNPSKPSHASALHIKLHVGGTLVPKNNSRLKPFIWTPPIAQYPSLILSDCVLICGLIMRSYLGPMMYSRPCASSPTRCFNTLTALQAIKGGSNRLTQVLGQYCCFCY